MTSRVQREPRMKIIIVILIFGAVCFAQGFLMGKVANAISNVKVYDLIQQRSHFELKSLHYLHLLNKCEGKG